MPRNPNLGQEVQRSIDARRTENARVTQLVKDRLDKSIDNVSIVGNHIKTIKITIPAKHYYYSVSHIPPHRNHGWDEYVLCDDNEEVMSCDDDTFVDKFSTYILNTINEELEMNSIYDQMNKIDDKESLDEKYNVRTLKDVKKLQESVNSTMITESTNETDVAIDWYCATGAADADGWPDEPLGDNEDFITAALDWWDTHKHIYGYDRKRTGSRKTNRAVIFYEDLLNLVKKNLSNLNIIDNVHISCPGHMWQIELQVGQKFNPTIVQCSEMHGKDSISLYPWKKFSDNDISWDFDNRKEIMITPASDIEELAKQIVDHVKCEVNRYKDTFNESLSEEHSDEWEAARLKLERAAQAARLHMDSTFIDHALEDDGAHLDDVIENEVIYISNLLKKKFPDLAFWRFVRDTRYNPAIQAYTRPKNSRRFYDVTFAGNYELLHGELSPIRFA